jgi:hypothetical protein
MNLFRIAVVAFTLSSALACQKQGSSESKAIVDERGVVARFDGASQWANAMFVRADPANPDRVCLYKDLFLVNKDGSRMFTGSRTIEPLTQYRVSVSAIQAAAEKQNSPVARIVTGLKAATLLVLGFPPGRGAIKSENEEREFKATKILELIQLMSATEENLKVDFVDSNAGFTPLANLASDVMRVELAAGGPKNESDKCPDLELKVK